MDRIFESDVMRRYMCFLKRTAGVARGTPNWALLAELNCKPYHFYWVRALLRFHKSLLSCNSPLLEDVVKADAQLASESHETSRACWSAEFAKALSSIADAAREPARGQAWAAAVRSATQLDTNEVLKALQCAYQNEAWKGCSDVHDVRSSNLVDADGNPVGRKFATYFAWFRPQQPGMAAYLWGPLSKHRMVKNMLRFRLGSHGLGCNTGRQVNPPTPWVDRVCTRCSEEHRSGLQCAVDDEFHAIFECEAFEALRVATRVKDMIASAGGCVRAFMFSHCWDCVMKFISGVMDLIDSQA